MLLLGMLHMTPKTLVNNSHCVAIALKLKTMAVNKASGVWWGRKVALLQLTEPMH